VYLSAEATLDWLTWANAALLAAGPDAVLVSETAVAIRHLVPRTLPVKVAVPVDRRCRWQSSNIDVLRLDIAEHERVTVDGLLTTTRMRSALDVAHLMPMQAAQPVLDRMLVLGQVDLDELSTSIAASRRLGSKQARRLMRSASDRAAAESERMAKRLLREAGLKGWVSNHPVAVRSGTILVDLALPRLRIAIEVKGWVFHSLSDRAMQDDNRVTDLGIAGWLVIPVGWLELVTDPTGVVARVRAAVQARELAAA
jgi:very-short-patch-repair endonuclease